MSKLTCKEAAELTDQLGVLKSQLAPLQDKEKEIKAKLAAYVGEDGGDVDGDFYHVNIAITERSTVDSKALIVKLAEYMKPYILTRFLGLNTKVSTFPTVKVTARVSKVQQAA